MRLDPSGRRSLTPARLWRFACRLVVWGAGWLTGETFMVCQTRVHQDDRRDFTKHMVRMRHATQGNEVEVNEGDQVQGVGSLIRS